MSILPRTAPAYQRRYMARGIKAARNIKSEFPPAEMLPKGKRCRLWFEKGYFQGRQLPLLRGAGEIRTGASK